MDVKEINGGIDFKLEKGKGYLVYKHTPEVIYQEAQESVILPFLEPGINLTGISPIPEGGSQYVIYIISVSEGQEKRGGEKYQPLQE